jgi:aerobic carbon-monoxide dehydrogenase medium subunit
MKPAPFELYQPASVAEALDLLADPEREIKPLAGGQSLVALMALRLARPDALLDLNRITELQYVQRGEDGQLRIGAMTRQSCVGSDPTIAAGWAPLHETVPLVAHAPIRNRGTLGGSLAHADPSAELCAVCLVLDASVVAQSTGGSRVIPLRELFLGPFMTSLAPDELLTEIVIPPLPRSSGWAFKEVTRRKGDFALAGVCALVAAADDGTIAEARLSYISMAGSAIRSPAAELALLGERGCPETFELAATVAVADMSPSGDVQASADFRLHLGRVLTKRALAAAWERAVAAA